MIKKFLFIALFIYTGHCAQAQVQTPVNWHYATEKAGNGEITVLVTAEIEPGFRIFSLNMKDGGPIKTRIKFSSSKAYELIGKATEPDPLTEQSDAFDMTLGYFTNKVVFKQKIKMLNKAATIEGRIEYMAENSHICLLPDEEIFSIPVQ